MSKQIMQCRKHFTVRSNVIASLVLFSLLSGTCSGLTFYVDDDAIGANNGTSWENAFSSLQRALAHSESAIKPIEIRVAQGIYRPDQGPGVQSGNREATFYLINNVTIEGGYAGLGTVNPDVRDVNLYETVLSGDLAGNDVAVTNARDLVAEETRYDNSYNVVTCEYADATTVLDGVTVTGGYATGSDHVRRRGGAMMITGGSPTVSNCQFTDNYASNSGGAMYVNSIDPGVPTLKNCRFAQNATDGSGGGIGNHGGSPIFSDCVIENNYALGNGGGMANNHSSPELIGCVFAGNECLEAQGGAITNDDNNPVISGCTFSNNKAWAGGAIFNHQASPELSDCLFEGNIAVEWDGGAIKNQQGSNPVITHCSFTSNQANGSGGAIVSEPASNMVLDNCTFVRNTTYNHGGGAILNNGSSAAIKQCTFIANSTGQNGGGGAIQNSQSTVSIVNSRFLRNSAIGDGGGDGGAMENYNESYVTVFGCVFAGNIVDDIGGAIGNWSSSLNIANSTFYNNQARQCGGVFNDDQLAEGIEDVLSQTLVSSILWGNIDRSKTGEAAQVMDVSTDYCCIQGWTGSLGGVGNIGTNPMFVDLFGWDGIPGNENDDPRLLSGSPCIDAGDNEGALADLMDVDSDGDITELIPHDLDNNPRFLDDPKTPDTGRSGTTELAVIDMGAYEGDNQGFVVSTDTVTVPEGDKASFTVSLAQDPLGEVEVTVELSNSADEDIFILQGEAFVLNSQNYQTGESVVLFAAEDSSFLDGRAVVPISASGIPDRHILVIEVDNDPSPAAGELVQWEQRDGGNGHWYYVVNGGAEEGEASDIADSVGGALALTETSVQEEYFIAALTAGQSEHEEYFVVEFAERPAEADMPVTFPDGNLHAAIQAQIGLTNVNLLNVRLLLGLSIMGKNVTSLEGLQEASNLIWFQPQDNHLVDPHIIADLPRLRSLGMGYCNLNQRDILFLEQMPELVGLGLGDVPDFDPSILSYLPNLEGVHLPHCNISDLSLVIDFLPKSRITNIGIYDNPIFDLEPIRALTELLFLAANRCLIRDITSLEAMVNLVYLVLDENQIDDLSAIAGLNDLYYLSLEDNLLDDTDMMSISSLTNLEILRLKGNPISDISPLSGLYNLVELGLSNMELRNVSPLAGLTTLDWLELGQNPISNISPLSGLVSLSRLDLQQTRVADISPLLNYSNLKYLNLKDCPLSYDSVDIYLPQIRDNNPKLEVLLYDQSTTPRR